MLNGFIYRSLIKSSRLPTPTIISRNTRIAITHPLSLKLSPRKWLSTSPITLNQKASIEKSPSKSPSKAPSKTLDDPKATKEDSLEPSPPKIIDNVYTIPNMLTVSRIITAPVIGYCIYSGHSTAAISLFTYSCITDFLDGFIARKFDMKSILGTILDPIADKLLMGLCTISLSLVNIMPGYLGAIIIGRDAMLALMGVYYRYKTLPYPKTFKRFANLSIPTVSVEPNLLSKVNTGLQMVYIGNLVFKPQIETLLMSDNYGLFIDGFGWLVATTTVLSGLSYIFSKKSIKTLSNQLKI